jgi:hypothetical protein
VRMMSLGVEGDGDRYKCVLDGVGGHVSLFSMLCYGRILEAVAKVSLRVSNKMLLVPLVTSEDASLSVGGHGGQLIRVVGGEMYCSLVCQCQKVECEG